MIEAVKATSWDHLTHILYEIPKNDQQRYRSRFVYRGVADKDWTLETSLKRIGPACVDVEAPLLRSFSRYAQPGEIPSDEIWFRLALAQHHGLPTRLLDWSFSPKVACHFATYEEQYFDRDGAIWCVDVTAAAEALPAKLRRLLISERADLFSVEMLAGIKGLADFDGLAGPEAFVLFFEPPSLDSRIINQGAVLSAMPGVEMDLRTYLETHPTKDFCRQIILPKSLKWEIRDKLDQDNVTERILFPGLDGLSRWLKRYYGPGPTGSIEEFRSAPTTDPRDEPHQRG
jgi:hypothetical protein